MKRFNNNNVKVLKNGKRVYRSKIYPINDNTIEYEYIVTEEGDRLDNIAFDYYGNSSLWWVIAVANNLHDSSLGMNGGVVLKLPKDYTLITNKLL
jgi:hypothetical protein